MTQLMIITHTSYMPPLCHYGGCSSLFSQLRFLPIRGGQLNFARDLDPPRNIPRILAYKRTSTDLLRPFPKLFPDGFMIPSR